MKAAPPRDGLFANSLGAVGNEAVVPTLMMNSVLLLLACPLTMVVINIGFCAGRVPSELCGKIDAVGSDAVRLA